MMPRIVMRIATRSNHAFIAPTDLIDIQPPFTIILIWLRLAQRRAFDTRQLRDLTLAKLKGQRNEAAAVSESAGKRSHSSARDR
jgi:hypothetical protein